MLKINVAIDGPGGAGKGTISKLLAKKLNLNYIDTGALYRSVGLYLSNKNIPEDQITQLDLENISIEFIDNLVHLNNQNYEPLIRKNEVSDIASRYSANPIIRKFVNSCVQEMIKSKGYVLEGRDTASTVIPNAEIKIYLDATPEIRAERRYNELIQKGEQVIYQEILEDIKKRDFRDMNRKDSPLKRTSTAFYIDSSNMTIDEVIELIIREHKNKINF